MSRRKPHNQRLRLERSLAATLRSNHVAVVNLDPSGWQGMVNWKNGKRIPPGRHVADAVCDIPHRWTVFMSGFCRDPSGRIYYKSAEIATHGICLAEHLTDAIEQHYRALLDTCNPAQVKGSGWIAIPNHLTLTEEQAACVFEACGAWQQLAPEPLGTEPCPTTPPATTPRLAAAGAA